MLLQTVSITLLFGHHQGTMQYHYFSFLIFAALLVGTFGADITLGSARIVGGYNALDQEFPYVVSLRQYGNHICGGAIINNDYVITTAQCVYGLGSSPLTVVAGTNTLSSGGVHYPVSRIVAHPSYDPYTYLNDIALLKVSTSFVFSSAINKIELPLAGETLEGATSTAIGWGLTSYPSSSLSNSLKKVDLTVLSNTECRYYHGSIYSTSLCASAGYGKGVCNGDSGGPLISGTKLIGLVSWGLPCAVGYPDVYTRVFEYVDWVNENAI